MDVHYTAVATASGRDGKAVTSDGRLDVTLAMPREMGGSGQGTNPEQLFAAGYAACFASAIGAVARGTGQDVRDVSVTAEVGIGGDVENGFGLTVVLRIELPDGLENGHDLVERAHKVCPYSNATRDNVPVELVIE
ncbi:Ohr subfamily peroxiredoxin [Actinomadura hallensis]|uniref:Ohr subfamily peroxiredoxin n=1 Tax=Actinomadura hallensis TaxID=337895 RepID=A0A543ID78_9ACTN|nr:organic hydroperoxide resistance protein [Actinomadura hallensis]TQM68524.1 Ohr subfamily peroxiredoxin [Actinomadura hallensis]HLV73894.1 organic hydroperoxide resistance protein [Vulgatibacteraceae bacterium]